VEKKRDVKGEVEMENEEKKADKSKRRGKVLSVD